ncbi:MAG TPA: flagellar protein FliS [Novosphingobium sp.]|jgi:flagellar protein FliS|nr:flagellar protein FliS [Novosphingobium sp.]HOA49780.1 flagellar protein FliS [Novosphingobium sp.]HPZ47580.1 flagellar protein FliS [Novosphingobium sp.]HQD99539.1 flagellar protein FliS [Novosphingobium sp.]HQQ09272.1 flagellar protein FliS [Novosphingobium sp.]
MLARNPQEAYRRVDFDARVAGADSRQLVALCYEQLTTALGTALFAAQTGDNLLKSQSLTRALSAITALQLGISSATGVGGALRQFYDSARKAVLDSVLDFDAATIGAIRRDCSEIAAAMLQEGKPQ